MTKQGSCGHGSHHRSAIYWIASGANRQFALQRDFELCLVADISVEPDSPMQLVYESQDDILVNFFADLLENAGIHCQVRNEVIRALES